MTEASPLLAEGVPADDQELIRFDLSPFQYSMVMCEKSIIWAEGPGREGKTFGAIASIFRHHQRLVDWYQANKPDLVVPPLQVAIIRDTSMNLKRNTAKSIQMGFPRQFSFWSDYHTMLESGCEPDHMKQWYERQEGPPPSWVDATLFGMDDMTSLDRIQGGEYHLIWIDEPAPIHSTGNNGIREEVYRVCRARVAGGLGPKRLQITMNPADEDHWTSKYLDDPDPETTAVFRAPVGSNIHIQQADRDALKDAYKGRADLTARFVEGRRAKVYAGVAVVPEFKEELHMAKEWLMPIPDLEVVRMWDGGMNPTCVLGQFTPSGRFHLLDCVVGENIGLHQLIESKLRYVLGRPRYQRVRRWRDSGDATLKNREQSDSDHYGAAVIETLLKTTYEPGVQDWTTRREALKWVFTQSPNGVPMVQINPRPTEGEPFNRLKAAFAGGYCYKVTGTGIILRDAPDKNIHSHPGDAISHVLAHMFFRPAEDDQAPKKSSKRLARASSYAVGN